LLPVDPYARNNANKKTVNFQISALGSSNKFGRGESTGVDLRWYKANEYVKLTSEQKDELTAWQKSSDGKRQIANSKKDYFASKKKSRDNQDDSSPRPNKAFKRAADKQNAKIASLESKLEEFKEKKADEQIQSEIASLVTPSQGQDKYQSIARQVMAIVASNRK